MKKTITLLAATFILVTAATAQKKSWYAGGSVGFSTSHVKYQNGGPEQAAGKQTSWNFSPEVGIFLTEHVQIGVGVFFGESHSNDELTPVATKNRNRVYGGKAYGRYFWGNQPFRPFVGLMLSGSGSDFRQKTGTVIGNISKATNYAAEINGGFAYNISKRVMVLGQFGVLGYSHQVSKAENSPARTRSSSFGFDASSLGDRFNVGFYFELGKKKP